MYFLLFVFVISIIFSLYFFVTFKFNYWHRKNVESLPGKFPFGNINNIILLRKSYPIVFSEIYQQINGPYGGIYFGLCPVLFVKNPNIIKDILIKNFDNFQNRGMHYDKKKEPLSAHLFRLENMEWKNLRIKLSPTFSSGKLKMHCDTILKCGYDFRTKLKDIENGADVNFSKVCQKYTTDAIASVGFGFDANCLNNEQTVFDYFANDIKHLNSFKKIVQQIILFIPEILKIFATRQQSIESEKFFVDLIARTIKNREDKNLNRDDYLQLLIQLKNQGYFNRNYQRNGKNPSENSPTTNMNQLFAQAYVYFIAGLETSNLSLSYTLYYLAAHRNIQKRLHSEIDVILNKYNGILSYESISEMEYLDMVVSESLRLRPPLSMLNRECNKPYKIPETNIEIEVGTKILISVLDLHMDPKYFPNPEEFQPERFSRENKMNLYPYCYLPFGDGPRNCIGARQGQLQIKIGLLSVLQDHLICLSDKTQELSKPLPGGLLMVPQNNIILKLYKRDKLKFK